MIQLTCAEFETRFHDLLDQRSEPSQDAQLFSHSQHCESCQQMVRAHASIESVLDNLSAQPASRLKHRPAVNISNISHWAAVAVAIVLMVAVTPHLFVSARSAPAKAESGDANIEVHVAENEIQPSSADEPGNHLLALASNFNLLIPDDLSSQAEWIEPVTMPMRPLQESVSSTINVLRRTIPGYRKTVDADGKTSYHITLENEWA